MVPRGLPYSDKYVALAPPGVANSEADFEIEFPESGSYELWAFYSAADSRPLALVFDGEVVSDKALGGVNGSWQTSASTWERQLVLTDVSAGKHTITVRASSPDIPHFSAFKLVPLFEMKGNWNVPRAIAKEKIGSASAWRPSPWSGGWYEYIARDRYQRKESGETFSDHFARETALALVPRANVTVTASAKPFDLAQGEINLNDELTYVPGMFDSEEENADAAEDRALYFRAAVADDADDSRSKTPSDEVFVARSSRFIELLDRSAAAIDRFRSDSGDDEYLSESLAKLNELREQGNEAFGAYQANPTDESAAKCAELYVDAVRLYTRVGWANPILDFDKLIFVQRNANDLGLPQNYQSNCVLNPNAFDDALKTLSLPFVFDETDAEETDKQIASDADVAPAIATLFKPDYPTFLGDLDLHFDAEKALVSATDRERRWNVFELDLKAAQENKPTDEALKAKLPNFPDADSYDACYLPDDSIIFTSTACYIGVPCVSGTTRVTNT
ncbi:MAG: hypothetical protein II655_04530, partial [Thermoguttaceae bacterium]|nr:hypothetical protein [Thermoguttaceae bacterium]